MKTINDFIKELKMISSEKRELPLVIQCPNGELSSPDIKMMWNNPFDMMETKPDKMIITY